MDVLVSCFLYAASCSKIKLRKQSRQLTAVALNKLWCGRYKARATANEHRAATYFSRADQCTNRPAQQLVAACLRCQFNAAANATPAQHAETSSGERQNLVCQADLNGYQQSHQCCCLGFSNSCSHNASRNSAKKACCGRLEVANRSRSGLVAIPFQFKG